MKYLINLVALIILAFIVIGIMKFKESDAYYELQHKTKGLTKEVGEFVAARKQSVAMEIDPERKRPLTFIDREEQLRMFVPTVFQGFTQDSWDNFWDYIYEPITDKSGKYPVKRQRNQEEIMSLLRNKYPKPFAEFREDQWFYFWQIVFGDNG